MAAIESAVVLGAVALAFSKKIAELSATRAWETIAPRLSMSQTIKRPAGMDAAIEAHTRATYERCTKIKTLISRDKPIDLLSVYVDVRFRHDNSSIDQYYVVDSTLQDKRVTICGTGGSGKSMFMKYLWISHMIRSTDKIPVFIELRQLNEISADELVVFLFNTIFTGVSNPDGIPYFVEMMRKGKFSFILDGFDEVKEEKKKIVERQIVEMSNLYQDCSFTVSTRPLDNIISWPQFKVFFVAPMLKEDVLLLVDRIDFEKKIKNKFSDAVKKHLFESHKSFLEIPLLASVMLFVFNDIADVPNEMNVFYDQAFWALFRRHDAAKEAFDRKLNSNLSLESFRSMIAAFCYFSYISAKPRITDISLLDHIRDASKFLNITVDSEAFKKDLMDNICFLQMDGIEYIFIHRTFQEYFAAVFISNLPESNWIHAVFKLPYARTENVIKLLFEMNSSRFDAAVTLKIADMLGPEIAGPEQLWARLLQLENAKTVVCIFAPNRPKLGKVKKGALYIFLSTVSNIYRFLMYYNQYCRNTDTTRSVLIRGVSPLDVSRLPNAAQKLVHQIIKIHKNDKNNKKISRLFSPAIEVDIFNIDENLNWNATDYFEQMDPIEIEEVKKFVIESDSYKDNMIMMEASVKSFEAAKNEKHKRDQNTSVLFGESPF